MRELPESGSWMRYARCVVWRFRWAVKAPAHAATAVEKMDLLRGLLPGFATPGAWRPVRRPGRGADHGDSGFPATELPLDLLVTASDGVSEAVVTDGARLILAPEPRDRDWQGITLDVALDADLYARRTGVETSYNNVLADLNAPRLAAFLARVRIATGAAFVSTAARPAYAAQIADYGFHPTRIRFSTADVFELVDRGREVQLSNELPDMRVFQPVTSTVDVSRAQHGRYRFIAHDVFNDGSCTSTRSDETLDRPASYERVTRLLTEGYT